VIDIDATLKLIVFQNGH